MTLITVCVLLLGFIIGGWSGYLIGFWLGRKSK